MLRGALCPRRRIPSTPPSLPSPPLQIVLLTARLFKYFKYQPRLAVISEGLANGCSDFAHVSLSFGLILAAYGGWRAGAGADGAG